MKNQLSQDVEDLKGAVDQVIIQTALNTVRVGILQSALLAVCEELLSDEAYKNLCTKYLSELKQGTDDAFHKLEEIAFEPGSWILKLKMDAHFQIEEMKRNLGIAD